ncbi:MAG TPA: hypothetical protein VFB60_04600 [Ktedonobacteraceae bacterium]|nr:hypothetical protein [Ktedonobacteraceae bacterium]
MAGLLQSREYRLPSGGQGGGSLLAGGGVSPLFPLLSAAEGGKKDVATALVKMEFALEHSMDICYVECDSPSSDFIFQTTKSQIKRSYL